MANFNDICFIIKSSNKDASQSAKVMANEILSDDNIVSILTSKRLDSLIYFFACIDRHQLDSKDLICCIPKIMQNLFLDQQSFFYKHLNMDGLAISSNIYHVFYFPNLIKNFNLLDNPSLNHLHEKEFKAERVKALITALTRLIETHKQSQNVPNQHIISGLRNTNELFRNLCVKINRLEKQGVDTTYELSEERMALHLIARFFSKFEGNKDDITPASESNFPIRTINQGFARALSQSVESLSLIEDHSLIYQSMMSLFHGLEFGKEQSADYVQEFEKQMWKKIAKNVVEGLFPPTLRAYLIYFRMRLTPGCFRTNKWMDEQLERTKKLLYNDLKPLLDKDAKMKDQDQKLMKDVLLPRDMVYKDGYFIYIDKWNRK